MYKYCNDFSTEKSAHSKARIAFHIYAQSNLLCFSSLFSTVIEKAQYLPTSTF